MRQLRGGQVGGGAAEVEAARSGATPETWKDVEAQDEGEGTRDAESAGATAEAPWPDAALIATSRPVRAGPSSTTRSDR